MTHMRDCPGRHDGPGIVEGEARVGRELRVAGARHLHGREYLFSPAAPLRPPAACSRSMPRPAKSSTPRRIVLRLPSP
jgi:hypothetical protein